MVAPAIERRTQEIRNTRDTAILLTVIVRHHHDDLFRGKKDGHHLGVEHAGQAQRQ